MRDIPLLLFLLSPSCLRWTFFLPHHKQDAVTISYRRYFRDGILRNSIRGFLTSLWKMEWCWNRCVLHLKSHIPSCVWVSPISITRTRQGGRWREDERMRKRFQRYSSFSSLSLVISIIYPCHPFVSDLSRLWADSLACRELEECIKSFVYVWSSMKRS